MGPYFFKRINKDSKDLLISHPYKDNWKSGWSHFRVVLLYYRTTFIILKKHCTILQIQTQRRIPVPIRTKSATPGNKTTGGITILIPEKYCHLLSNHIAHSNITQESQSQSKHFRNHPEPYGTLFLQTSGVKVSQSLLTY